MQPDWTGAILGILFGGVFGAIGTALLIFGINTRRKAKATEQWPTASGTITAARVDEQRQTHRSQGRTSTSTSYMPVVEYTYQANGATYHGSRISAGGSMSYDYGTAQRILSRYQPGQPAAVHYDPANPSQAVLETKAQGSVLLLVIGGIFLLIGLGAGCVTAVVALMSFFQAG